MHLNLYISYKYDDYLQVREFVIFLMRKDDMKIEVKNENCIVLKI